MTRQIKFRAWDIEYQKMNTSGTVGCGSGSDVINISFDGSVSLQNAFGLDMGMRNPTFDNPSERFILMQFTGLKDKNCVDIFEGDLVVTSKGKVFKCIYHGAGFKFICGNNKPYSTTSSNYLQIIGNIHENPELLKP